MPFDRKVNSSKMSSLSALRSSCTILSSCSSVIRIFCLAAILLTTTFITCDPAVKSHIESGASENVAATFVTSNSSINFTHLTIDPISGNIYLGAINHLYQLSDEDLSLRATFQTGPIYDSAQCSSTTCDGVDSNSIRLTKNVNKILLIDNSHRKLISCGSVNQGICRRHDLTNISNAEDPIGLPVAANDDHSSTFAFISMARYPARGYNGASGSGSTYASDSSSTRAIAGATDVLYVGTSNTKNGPYRDLLPAISSRSLSADNNLFGILEHSFSDSARVDISYHYRDTFLVKYIFGFSSSNYVYFAQVQKVNPARENEELGATSRLARICDSDPGYQTYSEISLICQDPKSGATYNILSDAHVSRIGPNLAASLNLNEGSEIFFGTFHQQVKSSDHMKTNSARGPSAICMFPLAVIEETFTSNIHSCFNGSQITRNMDYIAGNVQKCPEAGKSGNIISFCSETLKINGSIPAMGIFLAPKDSNSQDVNLDQDKEILTAITTSTIGRDTQIIVGNSNGQLKRFLIDKNLILKKISQHNVDLGHPILSDLITDRSNNFVYAMSPYRVVKIPIFETKINSNQDKDSSLSNLHHLYSNDGTSSAKSNPSVKNEHESRYDIIRRLTTPRSVFRAPSSSSSATASSSISLSRSRDQKADNVPLSSPNPRLRSKAPPMGSNFGLRSDLGTFSDDRLFYDATSTTTSKPSAPKISDNKVITNQGKVITNQGNYLSNNNNNKESKVTFWQVAPWIAAAIIGITSLTLAAIHRSEIALWAFTRYGIRLRSSSNNFGSDSNSSFRESEKLFDGFLSYSKSDENFVNQILAPELEYGPNPLRLCLMYRDLAFASNSSNLPNTSNLPNSSNSVSPNSGNPLSNTLHYSSNTLSGHLPNSSNASSNLPNQGNTTYYLGDAIVEAMESSKRSILVISENFLKYEWCKFEFKSAHLEILRGHAKIKNHLILITLGNINPEDFDPDLRLWLKSAPMLNWGEKHFWEKLKFYLPSQSSLSSSKIKSKDNNKIKSRDKNYAKNNLSLSGSSIFVPSNSFSRKSGNSKNGAQVMPSYISSPMSHVYSSVTTIEPSIPAALTGGASVYGHSSYQQQQQKSSFGATSPSTPNSTSFAPSYNSQTQNRNLFRVGNVMTPGGQTLSHSSSTNYHHPRFGLDSLTPNSSVISSMALLGGNGHQGQHMHHHSRNLEL